MEIKVGDYVRILENGYGIEYKGRIGRITRDGMVSTKEGLGEHREDGKDFHLCFFEDEYELVGTIKRLKPNPGDIVECVGYVDDHDYYWWTVGKNYVVTADGTPADNEGHTYGEYDDPQPAILFAIVSRATEQQKEEPEMKVGARVRVIANTCFHGFDIGQIVVLKGVFNDSLCFHSEGDPEDPWCMTTEDFVRVEDEVQVFYQLEGIGFFEKEPAYYDKRLVLNHTTGTFTLSDF